MALKLEGVLFDCDGTLVASEPITTDVLVGFATEYGLQFTREEGLKLFAGRDMALVKKVLEERTGRPLPDDFIDQFRDRQKIALETKLESIDGADALLQSTTLPYSLASNAPREKITVNLRVTGLDRFFPEESIFSAYDINVWKPAPDLFLHVAEKMEVEPGAMIVVEDSPAGVEAAIRAGMHVIAFLPDRNLDGLVSEELMRNAVSIRSAKTLSQVGGMIRQSSEF